MLLNEDFDLEMGSWVDIRNAAVKVLLVCRLPFEEGGEQRTGGWITSGAENGLVVELGTRRVGFGGGNGTGAGVERGMNAVDVV